MQNSGSEGSKRARTLTAQGRVLYLFLLGSRGALELSDRNLGFPFIESLALVRVKLQTRHPNINHHNFVEEPWIQPIARKNS